MSQITLKFRDKTIAQQTLRNGTITIGTDPACDISVDTLALRPRHLQLTTVDDVTTLLNLEAEHAVNVNGSKVIECPLQHEDLIEIGKYQIIYQFNKSKSDAPPDPIFRKNENQRSAWLQLMSGKNIGKTVNLKRALNHIGKAGVQMDLIAHRDDGFYLSHLEGPSIPSVNGVDLSETAVMLNNGDSIKIANVVMIFSLS
ncbi:MAG: FHA domain-containing protein [Gammaproteobacteria bacterium]|nr:FHA domain-containing protein [Gammaproteobacteria bacterium]